MFILLTEVGRHCSSRTSTSRKGPPSYIFHFISRLYIGRRLFVNKGHGLAEGFLACFKEVCMSPFQRSCAGPRFVGEPIFCSSYIIFSTTLIHVSIHCSTVPSPSWEEWDSLLLLYCFFNHNYHGPASKKE